MRVFILATILLAFPITCFAQRNTKVEDRIIGSTFRTLARAFVVTVDLDKLKKNNIEKLNKIDEEKFNKRYAKVYKTIKDLPVQLKSTYKVTEAMSKEQAVKNIESLDKKKIYAIIDAIPDQLIARQFKQYLREKKEEVQKSRIVEQIKSLWNKIIVNALRQRQAKGTP